MNILFVSLDGFYCNTSSVMQNKGIVQGLHNLGHTVDVLTLEPLESMTIYDETMDDMAEYVRDTFYLPLNPIYKKLAERQGNFVEKTGKESPVKTYFKSKVRRFLKSCLVFDIRALNVSCIKKIKLELNQYDIVISASDPKSTHYVTRALIKNRKFKNSYIQYWGDPLYLDITRIKGPFDFIFKMAEEKLISCATRVVYATPLTLTEQQKLFPLYADKMIFVNQAAPYEKICERRKKSHKKIEILYCGDYRSTTRNITPLYNTVSNMKGGNLHLTICGTSDLVLKDNDNVTIKGFVNHEEATRLESDADILIGICNLKGSQIPGKFYYLTKHGTPIIVILDGENENEIRRFFDSFGRYILCGNDEEEIKDALEAALKNPKCWVMPENLKPEAIARRIIA